MCVSVGCERDASEQDLLIQDITEYAKIPSLILVLGFWSRTFGHGLREVGDRSGRDGNGCLLVLLISSHSPERAASLRKPAPSKETTAPASRQGIGPQECPAHIEGRRPGSIWLQKKPREVTRGHGRAQCVPKGVSWENEEPCGEGRWGQSRG